MVTSHMSHSRLKIKKLVSLIKQGFCRCPRYCWWCGGCGRREASGRRYLVASGGWCATVTWWWCRFFWGVHACVNPNSLNLPTCPCDMFSRGPYDMFSRGVIKIQLGVQLKWTMFFCIFLQGNPWFFRLPNIFLRLILLWNQNCYLDVLSRLQFGQYPKLKQMKKTLMSYV